MNKVDRALEMRVIDWLQWTEWKEIVGQKHPSQLTLEMINIRKQYCKDLEFQKDFMVKAFEKIMEVSGTSCEHYHIAMNTLKRLEGYDGPKV